jgi:hypothetical protein
MSSPWLAPSDLRVAFPGNREIVEMWHGAGGRVTVAPLLALYDYSFQPPGVSGKADGLALAYARGVVCSDGWAAAPGSVPGQRRLVPGQDRGDPVVRHRGHRRPA